MHLARLIPEAAKAEAMLFTGFLVLLWANFVSVHISSRLHIRLACIDILLAGADIKHQYTVLQNSTPFLWIMLACLAASTGLVQAILNINNKRGYGFLLSLAGIISMLMLQVSLGSSTAGVTIQFTWAYWAMLTVFALAGSISYLSRQNHADASQQQNENKGLHINIITNPAKEAKPKGLSTNNNETPASPSKK